MLLGLGIPDTCGHRSFGPAMEQSVHQADAGRIQKKLLHHLMWSAPWKGEQQSRYSYPPVTQNDMENPEIRTDW